MWWEKQDRMPSIGSQSSFCTPSGLRPCLFMRPQTMMIRSIGTAGRGSALVSRQLSTQRLIYKERGDPSKVIELVSGEELSVPSRSSHPLAVVKWLAVPINPADINQIQGVYPVRPPLPATGGNEGCGVVEQIVEGVSDADSTRTRLEVGQRVIPAQSGLGTWCTHGVHRVEELYPIDGRLRLDVAATFQVNPPTAYCMLKDFVDLEAIKRNGKERPVILQNGANSSVGRYVTQIAKLLGYMTINLVRDRPELGQLKEELSRLGADYVLTEEEFPKALKGRELPKAHLGLNCVGGKSSLLLCRALGDEACLVTYGAMSKQPLQVSTGSLIFNDVSCRGFWMSRWYERKGNPSPARDSMYKELSEWFIQGALAATPVQRRRIEEYKEALELATGEVKGAAKQLFTFADQ